MSARACDGCKHCVRVDDRAHCSRPGADGDAVSQWLDAHPSGDFTVPDALGCPGREVAK